MAKVYINGEELEIGSDERLNGIQAAERVGVEVPHYCWHPGLSVVASCRMCLVETGRRDTESGEISMMPKLVPACQTPATDGTVFVTNSDKVTAAREMVEEDLLIRHPIDCPICDKAGECHLQDYHFQHGRPERRADLKPFTSRRRPMGDTVTLFVDRCVMCSRCVRFTREISGTKELMIVDRGAHEEIDVFPGFPLDNKLSGNVVDLCPVGALGDRDFLYSQRVWFMKSHDAVCGGCSTGCSIHVEENQDQVYRLKPRENPHINQWWMCDEGRYGFKHVHSENRVTQPRRKTTAGYVDVQWSDLPEELDGVLRGAGRLAAIVSPHLTVEEAYLLCSYLQQLDPDALLAVGPIPHAGEDESFPNGFTIRAEKCPNRRGVEAIVSRMAGGLVSFESLADRLSEQSPDVLWVAGAYPTAWIDETTADRLSEKRLTIVQDLFETALWSQADYQLPAVAFAERQGSYVNACDRLQSFDWAIRPPAGAMSDGQLFWRLLGRTGLFNARKVMQEIAREIAFFAPAAEPVPAVGVDLRVNQLADPENLGASV
ncbi:MAG: 2Fe-2S iron-sulfur cluster binding domain-containing protein [Planctomycetaceae bacterium]|nr:2Fe-2S iron-sulfur cluster binding domain-containing protein [Planctomycetaceae bacterium]